MLIDIKYAVLRFVFKAQVALLDSRYLTMGKSLNDIKETTNYLDAERKKTLIKRAEVAHKLRRIECRIY